MATDIKWNARRGAWYVQYWQGGWRRKTVAKAPPTWKPGDPEPRKKPPEAYAEKTRLEAIEKAARAGEAADLPVSLREFMEEHKASYRNPRTRKNVGAIIDRFVRWCESHGIHTYQQVTKKVCKAWIQHDAAGDDDEGRSISSVATNRGYIAAAWGRQVRDDEIDKSPWKGVRAIGEDRIKPRKSWTKDEFERLLKKCQPWLQDVLIVGVHTGLRVRALIGLEWDHRIHPESDADRFGYIHVPPHLDKIKAGYKVPVSRKLDEVLRRRFGRHHPRFILTGRHGRPITSRTHTFLSIRRACKRANLPVPQSPNHHMRRTFGRWAILGHLTGTPVPLYVVSRWLGHKDPKTTLRYLDIIDQESANWMVPQISAEDAPSESDSKGLISGE